MKFLRAPGAPASTLAAMSAGFDQLLDATLSHLQNLKAQGVRYVAVSPALLAALRQPAPVVVRPSESVPQALPYPPKRRLLRRAGQSLTPRRSCPPLSSNRPPWRSSLA